MASNKLEKGDPVKVLDEHGRVMALGKVVSLDENRGWYEVRLARLETPQLVRYPATRVVKSDRHRI